MKALKITLAALVALVLAYGAGAWHGYHIPRSDVDPQDYIESVFTPYEDGLQAYLNFLDKVQTNGSIRIAAYSFTQDEITDKLIALKQNRKVDVRLILDQSQSGQANEQEQIEKLRAAGIEVVIGKSEAYGQIMHDKYTVIDGIWTYSGSWNFSNSASKQANELDFIKSKKRARMFLDNWERQHKFMTSPKKKRNRGSD